jgi:hypothetical protein
MDGSVAVPQWSAGGGAGARRDQLGGDGDGHFRRCDGAEIQADRRMQP